MGRDPLTARATANPPISLVAASLVTTSMALAERSSSRKRKRRLLSRILPNSASLIEQIGRPIMSHRRLFVLVLLLLVAAAVRRVPQVGAGDWLPISPEE